MARVKSFSAEAIGWPRTAYEGNTFMECKETDCASAEVISWPRTMYDENIDCTQA